MPFLDVRNLHTSFETAAGTVRAVNGVSFSLEKGRVYALLGESGSGKSVTLRSIIRVLPKRRTQVSGEVWLDDVDLLSLSEPEMRNVRGKRVSMIFQEPIAAFDPIYTCGKQIEEGILRHQGVSKEEAVRKTRELLQMVQIPEAQRRSRSYPHELSGGMRQRMMIAGALACDPDLLLADEPSTSLDVTVQAQILALIRDLQESLGMAVIFVTHDLSVVAEIADEVAVMYGGRIVEFGPVVEVLQNPQHPYTRGLLEATVRGQRKGTRLVPIPGSPPDLTHLPPGCSFAPRCSYAHDDCLIDIPGERSINEQHFARCVLVKEGVGFQNGSG
jgi:peptide/nickel transport system ATP-binding protein